MFCFKCGASMPEDATVCPQCAAPVQAVPTPPPPAQQPSTPNPASTSAWLNVPSAPSQQTPPQYPPQAQPYRAYQPAQTDGGAIASMVLGIASIVLCLTFLAGIPAIIVGHLSLSRIKKSMGRLKGEGMALTGLILGYISLPFILIIAAIAIPNLIRARTSANEAAAASTMRTINTAQITYSTTYPEQGFARDLATLGPVGTSCTGGPTAEHACLLDSQLGQATCTSGVWCQKGQYKFTISTNCTPARFGEQQQGTDNACSEYVIAATPTNSNAGHRSFCSVSDSIVRWRSGFPLATPPTAEECQGWAPIT